MAYRMQGEEQRSIRGFGGENLWASDHLGKSSCKREDNIKTDLEEKGHGAVDWIDVDQDRNMWAAVVNAVRNLRVP